MDVRACLLSMTDLRIVCVSREETAKRSTEKTYPVSETCRLQTGIEVVHLLLLLSPINGSTVDEESRAECLFRTVDSILFVAFAKWVLRDLAASRSLPLSSRTERRRRRRWCHSYIFWYDDDDEEEVVRDDQKRKINRKRYYRTQCAQEWDRSDIDRATS